MENVSVSSINFVPGYIRFIRIRKEQTFNFIFKVINIDYLTF